ncbi:chromosome partitioning protein [Stenotrophomonas sp. PvP093]|uniref:ParA family protein n=1 Tax=unclassified Stenotrophomonas TaxID=196198 RepID=UPI001AE7648C|nr:ParA family protein [Stenotrophomonas sp. PvP093]MBP2480190.1 chromosome partitioning protein [Stenotrophomonas sp. PvP093]
MKSLAVANQKGGVGKTTMATHLGWFAAEQGQSVLLLDLDPQGNASSTFKEYAVPDLTTSMMFAAQVPSVPVQAEAGQIALIASDKKLVDLDKEEASTLSNFVRAVKTIGAGFDLVIVDVGPSLGNRMHAALLACDALISPITPETYAIEGVAEMIQTHRRIKMVKEKAGLPLVFLGILLTNVNRQYPRHKATAKTLLETHGDKILPVWMPTRSVVGDSQSARLPVWKMGSSSRDAGNEMRDVCKFILDKLSASV